MTRKSISFGSDKLYVIGFPLYRLEVGSLQAIVLRIVPQVVNRNPREVPEWTGRYS
jgi:hypothetical protein